MINRYAAFLILSFCFFSTLNIRAQEKTSRTSKTPKTYHGGHLFESDDILHFKLTGKLNDLYKDISDKNSFHPILLQYLQKDSTPVSINLMVKTRGHFRRIKGNCKMPPLLLQFPKGDETKNTVFDYQNNLKLVVPCQGDDYVINEWLVYKLYNLLSDKSFKARLVQVDFEDSLKRKKTETHYCILLEDAKKMAERNHCFIWKKKMLDMRKTNLKEFEKMAVFQYMIGNTDWGVPYLQNIVLITKDSSQAPTAVPYDFDHAGIVGASYAGPAPELEIASTTDRLYRGFCETDLQNFADAFELFNRLKSDIYKIYTDCPLLNSRYIKVTSKFLDEFYKTINNNKAIESEFGLPCRTNIRVEIKGLKD
ncbi:MAG: hypothetical protein M3139_00590 [Bacteroidota bacterium]|nr:hypothetical protein [Bacteroidota bacterium]